MFILIAPVENFNFGFGSEVPKWRKDLTFPIKPKQAKIEPILFNNEITEIGPSSRELLLMMYMAQTYEKDSLSSKLKSSDFKELFFEQNGDILDVIIFGEKYVPCPLPDEYDAMSRLNMEFKILTRMVENGDLEVKNIVCDFSNVKHMNSEGLGALIELKKAMDKTGIRFELKKLNPQLQEVMRITNLNSFFDFKFEELDFTFGNIVIYCLVRGLITERYTSIMMKNLSEELQSITKKYKHAKVITLDFEGVRLVNKEFFEMLEAIQKSLEKKECHLIINGLESLSVESLDSEFVTFAKTFSEND